MLKNFDKFVCRASVLLTVSAVAPKETTDQCTDEKGRGAAEREAAVDVLGKMPEEKPITVGGDKV